MVSLMSRKPCLVLFLQGPSTISAYPCFLGCQPDPQSLPPSSLAWTVSLLKMSPLGSLLWALPIFFWPLILFLSFFFLVEGGNARLEDYSSLSKEWTQAPCSGRVESYLLDHHRLSWPHFISWGVWVYWGLWVSWGVWVYWLNSARHREVSMRKKKEWMNLAVSMRSEYSIVKSMVFPVVMYRYELDHKEDWALKNWCFQIVVLEKTLESALDSEEIKPFNPKGNQPWIFIGRADAEASVLWPPDMKSWLTGKDPDAEKDRRQKEKGVTEDEMVR